MWMRARVVAVPLVVVALMGAGCGGGGSAIAGLTPYQVVVDAATATMDANTSKFTFALTIGGLPTSGTTPADVEVTGTGAFDYEEHRGAMKTTIPAGASTATLDSVIVGTTVYQKIPASLLGSTPFETGKPWIKIDLARLGSFRGINLGTLASAQSSDPSQAIAFLRGAGTDVEEVGREKLRGDGVNHYRFTIDLKKATESAPDEVREALEQFAGIFGGATIPADAWIDDDGRLRKLTYVLQRANFLFPVEASDDAAQAKVTTTVELFDFGTEVEAEAPPAEQVADFTELVEGGAK